MRKVIYILSLLTIFMMALVSCTKEPVDQTPSSGGIHMTLGADFNALTKASYTPDGSVLKASWDATETISIVTFDAENQGKILTVDNFTSTGEAGRQYAEFSGTYTGGDSPKKIIAIYPALTETDGKYNTAQYTDYTGTKRVILGNAAIGNKYFAKSENQPLIQTINNNAEHLKNYCVLTGVVDTEKIKENKLSVSLRNLMTVLKLNLNFDDSQIGQKLNKIKIQSYDDSFSPTERFNLYSWEYADIDSSNGLNCLGSGKINSAEMYSSIDIPNTKNVILYLPLPYIGKCNAYENWTMTLTVNDTELLPMYYTFTTDVEFKKGYMYTLNY